MNVRSARKVIPMLRSGALWILAQNELQEQSRCGSRGAAQVFPLTHRVSCHRARRMPWFEKEGLWESFSQ